LLAPLDQPLALPNVASAGAVALNVRNAAAIIKCLNFMSLDTPVLKMPPANRASDGSIAAISLPKHDWRGIAGMLMVNVRKRNIVNVKLTDVKGRKSVNQAPF
jgi:hypothetical protein